MSVPEGDKIGKPKLTVEILRQHRIRFMEAVTMDGNPNDWLRPLLQQLIHTPRRLLGEAEDIFNQEMEDFCDSGQDWKEAFDDGWSLQPTKPPAGSVYFRPNSLLAKQEVKKLTAELIESTKVASEARRARERSEKEAAWTLFLRNNFFRTFNQVYPNSESHQDTLEPWELHQDVHWNEWQKWTNMNLNFTARTGPKPDLTYAFPIIDITEKKNSSYLHDSHVESFSLLVLSKLRAEKDIQLKSAPTTSLRKWEKTKRMTLDATDLMCFPWAIVEVKRNKTPMTSDPEDCQHNKTIASRNKKMEQFCYCQAANASAAALELRENLITKAGDKFELRDALVIFSVTCVGPSVRLWVTYREKPMSDTDRKPFITMKCIWATSLELTWGVIALRTVMENMRKWVYGRVKPQLSRWIQMIETRPSPQYTLSPGLDQSMRARRATSCEPVIQSQASQPLEFPYRTPSKAPPSLPRGETAPGSVDRQKFNGRTPRMQVNGRTIRNVRRRGERGESDDTDSENEADEGYISNKSYDYQSKPNEEKSKGSSLRSKRSPSISKYVINKSEIEDLLQQRRRWYAQSSEEDPEEVDRGEEEDESQEENENEISPDEEGYFIESESYTPLQSRLKIHGSPKSDRKLRTRPKRDQSPSPGDRRRRSRS